MPHPSPWSFVQTRFTPAVRRRAARALVTTGVLGAAALASGAVASCGDDSPTGADVQVLRGAEVPFGSGAARTELAVRGTTVVSVAVVLSEKALDGLPAQLPPMQSLEFILPLPADAPATVFDHVGVNWQPSGHPPDHVYTTPHFDVHFYMATRAQRDAITPADPQFGAKTLRQPTPEERPVGYTLDPAAIPRMGVHSADAGAPELRGQPFTTTLIYGFYDGAMIFVEPMLTRAFLLARPDTTMKIATPARYPRAGAYPAAYAVRYDAPAREYRVELREFVDRR